ncbi:DUF4349 domain-containing protein [Myxococcota bacterium]|nr:DUF4349 domain-containing protein [Myxococcota bacterium]
MLRQVLLLMLSALVCVWVTACAKRSQAPAEAYYGYAPEASMDYGYAAEAEELAYDDAARSRAPAAPMPAGATAAAYKTSTTASTGGEGKSSGGGSSGGGVSVPKSTRMVFYTGYAQLRVTRPEELVESVAKAAEAKGGYVERRSLTSITVRVPVAEFEAAWREALGMGEVMSKSLTAQDVTEAFQDVELRLAAHQAMLARYQELLAKTTEEQEKLRILREIQRLSEEIDLIQSQLRTLGSLAAFSRLTVEGVPRQALVERAVREEIEGFDFIQRLSPFRADVNYEGELLKLAVPEGFVALDDRQHFSAESADGAILRATKLENEPAGDATFWISAIQDRLASEFASAERSEIGGFQVLRLVEPGADDPYRYLIAVRVEGKHLQLVEIVYPGAAQEERYNAAVRAALAGEVG